MLLRVMRMESAIRTAARDTEGRNRYFILLQKSEPVPKVGNIGHTMVNRSISKMPVKNGGEDTKTNEVTVSV